MNEHSPDNPIMSGYAVGYGRDKGAFRVYISLVLAAVFLAIWWFRGSEIALAIGIFFGVAGYYFYPLVETGKVRLGAGQYGVFIEGFGVIPWRSIRDIRLSTYAVRTMMMHDLEIELSSALPKALMADWRSLPYHRLLMKLPWSMGRDNVVRVNLEPFEGEPDSIVD
ncbi:MAG: hypothetical protein RLZ98_3587, partial [Pseudomonadota bacterium]